MTCGVSSNGAVSTACSFSASASSDVRLIAVAGTAYQFLGWSGDADCSGTTAMITFTNNRNRTCTPHFIRVAYTQVAGFTSHQCAVTTNGGVQCWGSNDNGQLGLGFNGGNANTPRTTQGISTAIAVAVGNDHSCALLMDKTVQCWGENNLGQLGTGNTNNSNTPVKVINLTNIIAIGVGFAHTCAVNEGGHAFCWGSDLTRSGVLGLDAIAQAKVPTTLSNITNAVAIASSISHTCALLNNGRAKCWGAGNNGQLGTGNTSGRKTPGDDVANLTTAMAISTGNSYTCALLNNGRAKCWGRNHNGLLGTGNTNNSSTPVDVTNLSNVVTISAGFAHTCALLNNGRVQCWGSNDKGQLGLGFNGGNATEPRSILRITTAIAMDVRNSESTTCAILTDGNAYCWGTGYGNIPTPVPGQPGVPTPSATISVYSHSPFIAVSPDRTIPATVTNNPAWLQYSASTGVFYGIPTSAASGITITPGNNPRFSVSPVTFSITIKDLPTLTSLTIEDTDARANNIPIDAAVNAPLPNPRLIAKDQSDSEVQVPLRWSLTQAAGVFRINDNTGTLALAQALTVMVTAIDGLTGLPTRFANVSHTITVRTDFPALIETLFQPNLPTATGSQGFVITAVPESDPLKLHIKTFLEGPLQ